MILEELYDVSFKWRHIGLQLGIQDSTLMNFQRSNPSESFESLRETLSEWLNNSPSTIWLDIVKALKSKSVGENRLASVIEAKYCSTHDVEASTGKTIQVSQSCKD